MKNKSGTAPKILLIGGLLLICVTFTFNQKIVAEIFPTYQVPVTQELRIGIFVLDALFVLVAIFVLGRRKSRAEMLVDLSVGLGFTLLLLVGIEGVFYYLNIKNENERQIEDVVLDFIRGGETADVQFEGEHSRALFQRDEWLGYRPVPNTQVAASRKEAGKTLYNVVYSTDPYGRRVTPVGNLEPEAHFILFFGGSYTFGEGVNDDETMPAFVSQLAPRYRSYNYGVGGYGPQQMLAQLQREHITVEVEETEGILIYTFINEHILRAVGSMRLHNHRGEIMPYYFIDADGKLTRKGNLVSGRPVQSLLYAIGGKSQTLLYFNIDFPMSPGDRELKTTTQIFKEARNAFQDKFNSDKFYILIYPSLGAPELLPYLEAANITYLDYSDLPDVYDPTFWLGEGHPSAKGHSIVAEKLVEDLRLLDKE